MPIPIRVKKLHPAAKLPTYAHQDDFGDLAADLYAAEPVTLAPTGQPGSTHPVPTGISLEFPPTHGALVEDRSGLAVRGITTLAGVIDPGYRGEIKVLLTNLNPHPIDIRSGDRIAQLRIVQRITAAFAEVEDLGTTLRNDRGFGSTGV